MVLEAFAEPGALAWPLALTCACAGFSVADRVRAGRRRERLNLALHELRRPLQVLTLAPRPDERRQGQLELAIAALGRLDREVNGGEDRVRRRAIPARALADDALARWRLVALARRRPLELRWSAGAAEVPCDPEAIAQALDNLIANSFEHGTGPVRLEGAIRPGRLRLSVSDGADARVPGPPPRPASGSSPAIVPIRTRERDPRRGHGLRLVADVAADHGGRFAACRHGAGASAVLELPLADAPA